MAELEVTNATFEPLPERPLDRWQIRVVADGSGFEHRAAPLVARVGDLPLESVMIKPDGDGFIGFLPTQPSDGDELRVGYVDGELVATGIEYERPPDV